jgi:hypothetical protein
MSGRLFTSTGAAVILGLILAPSAVGGQTAASSQTGTRPPAAAKTTPAKPAPKTPNSKTPWGEPDLQGVYTFSTLTPLQRPTAVTGKTALTEAELAEQEELDAQNRVNEDRPLREGDTGTYNNFWTSNEKGRRTGKTALIIDPEDGRLPELTPEGKKQRDRLTDEAAARRVGTPPYEYILYKTWSELPAYTQCLSRPMPRLAQSYNHGIEIIQSPGYVVIFYESMHNARIIPVDRREHLPDNVRLWDGDARGHWEGNTLVVDWKNFDPRQEFQGALQGNMHITERFTRVDANTVNEVVTVDDPTTWTKPWTYVLPWRSDDPNYQQPEDLYEYACHEGNYRQMENALAGSRAIEEAAKAGKLAVKPQSK